MITDEQIKNLKPGDPIVIHTTVDKIDNDGDLWFHCPQVNDANWREYINPKFVSLPGETMNKSKYDPCRKFKEGDIVDYRRRYGRDYETVPDPEDYKIARVFSSEEEESGMVGVEFVEAYGGDNVCFVVPWFHLELVTPVEELEPYSVHESEVIQGFDIVRDKLCVMTFPFGEKENGWYHNRLAAKAAAETERDRLNAEWKKLQAYGDY